MNQFVISNETELGRIDVYLAGAMDRSRSHVQQLIKEGLITVNGNKVKANFQLSLGDIIQVETQEAVSTEVLAEDIPLDILFEDSDMIIVNKARGMVVHPAAGNYSGTLVNALLFHCKDLSGINGEIRPGIVHRLDKDTSGVMMVAKNDASHLHLAEQIKEHTAKRTYWAIVDGNIPNERGTIKAPIGRHPKDRLKMAVVFENSKEAVTHFTVLERFGAYTLVECSLETGRTHQIRVHFAYIGHPVVNDPVYGRRKMPFPIEGQALHSRTLDVVHPTTEKAMHLEAPLPQDFLDSITFAKEHARGVEDK